MKLRSAGWMMVLALLMVPFSGPSEEASKMTSEDAWQTLLKGNAQFVANGGARVRSGQELRHRLSKGQHPIAAVLACSDSRVPPEIIFNQGLGDLYVVRVAGNVAEPATVASLEYAVDHLGVPLIVVLGHEGCGEIEDAVKAWTVEYDRTAPRMDNPADLSESMSSLLKMIFPAIEIAHTHAGDLTVNTVETNVTYNAWQLGMKDKLIAAKVKEGRLLVKGAVYDPFKGTVRELDTQKDENLPEKEQE